MGGKVRWQRWRRNGLRWVRRGHVALRLGLLPNRRHAPRVAAAAELFAQAIADPPTTGGDDLITGVADLRVGDGGGGRHGGVLPAMISHPVITYDASQASYETYDQ